MSSDEKSSQGDLPARLLRKPGQVAEILQPTRFDIKNFYKRDAFGRTRKEVRQIVMDAIRLAGPIPRD